MIFISHSREDGAVASRIMRGLRARGVCVTRDPAAVQGNAFWRRQVRGNLENSSVMLVLWSRHAAQSPWVDQEVRHFNGPQHFLRLDSVAPPDVAPIGNPSRVRWDQSPVASWAASMRCELATDETRRQLDRSTRPDTDDESAESKSVHHERLQALAAAESRLARFRGALGRRVPRARRLYQRRCQLDTGDVLIRLPPGVDETHGPSDEVYLSTMPVTNEQYGRFVQATGHPRPPTWDEAQFRVPDAPVVGVTWFEAMAYAAWIGGDLPTELEWEWAATAGDRQVEYATKDGRLTNDQAHFGRPLAEGAPAPSSTYPSNSLGFYGMCGNTWDWCASTAGQHRVIRGGGYMDSPRFCTARIAYRNAPIDRDCCVGFRIAVVIAIEESRRKLK